MVACEGGHRFVAMHGLETSDALQVTRITLFHMLLTWMLGRILLAHGCNPTLWSSARTSSSLGVHWVPRHFCSRVETGGRNLLRTC